MYTIKHFFIAFGAIKVIFYFMKPADYHMLKTRRKTCCSFAAFGYLSDFRSFFKSPIYKWKTSFIFKVEIDRRSLADVLFFIYLFIVLTECVGV